MTAVMVYQLNLMAPTLMVEDSCDGVNNSCLCTVIDVYVQQATVMVDKQRFWYLNGCDGIQAAVMVRNQLLWHKTSCGGRDQ